MSVVKRTCRTRLWGTWLSVWMAPDICCWIRI